MNKKRRVIPIDYALVRKRNKSTHQALLSSLQEEIVTVDIDVDDAQVSTEPICETSESFEANTEDIEANDTIAPTADRPETDFQIERALGAETIGAQIEHTDTSINTVSVSIQTSASKSSCSEIGMQTERVSEAETIGTQTEYTATTISTVPNNIQTSPSSAGCAERCVQTKHAPEAETIGTQTDHIVQTEQHALGAIEHSLPSTSANIGNQTVGRLSTSAGNGVLDISNLHVKLEEQILVDRKTIRELNNRIGVENLDDTSDSDVEAEISFGEDRFSDIAEENLQFDAQFARNYGFTTNVSWMM